MRLFLLIYLLIPIVLGISIPGENVDKKRLTSIGIKTIEWQEENGLKQQNIEQSQAVHKLEQNELDEDEHFFKGQSELGSQSQYQQSNHDIFQIINAEQSHYKDLEDFEQEFQASNAEEENLYSQKPVQKTQAFLECPKMVTSPLPYASSCSQFLNCYKGRGVVQNCAPGTLFNPHTLECDYASKVKCLDEIDDDYTQQSLSHYKLKTGCPRGFSGIVPHHFDCSKFINCDNGKEIVMDCGPGTLFNLKINSCDFPYNTECASWSSQFGNIKAESDSHSQHVNLNQSPSVQTSLQRSDNEQAGSNYNYNTEKPKCPPDAMGLYPHPWDCAKFLNCAQGKTFIQDCGPGTVFNPLSKVCDFPYNVKCNTHEDYNIDDIDVRILHGQINGSSTKVQPTISCPPKAYGLYPYPNICSKFMDCRYGKTEIKECPEGLVYNIIKKGCDYSYNVDCKRKNLKEIWSTSNQNWNQQENQGTWNQQNTGQTVNQGTYDKNWNQQNTGHTVNQGSYDKNWNQQNTGHTVNQGTYDKNWNQQNSGQTANQGSYDKNWNHQNTGHTVNQGTYDKNWNQQNTGQAINQGTYDKNWNKPNTGQTVNQGTYDKNWNQQNTGQTINQGTYDNNWNQPNTGHTVNQGSYDKNWNQQNTGELWNQGTSQHVNNGSTGQGIDKNWNQQNTWNQKPINQGETWNQTRSSQTGINQSTGQNWNQWNQKPTNQEQSWNQAGTSQTGYNQNWNQQSWNQRPTNQDQSLNQPGSSQNNYNNWNQQSWNQKPTGQGQPWNQPGSSQNNYDKNWNEQQWNQKPTSHGQSGTKGGSKKNNYNQNWNQTPTNQGQSGNQVSTSQNGYNQNWNQQSWNQKPTNQGQSSQNGNNQNWNQGKTDQQAQSSNQRPFIYGQDPFFQNKNNFEQTNFSNNVNPAYNSKFKDSCSVLDFYCTQTQCIPKSMRCDGVTDCPNGDDEKDCEFMLDQFTLNPNHILAVREKEKFFNISILNCARSCLSSVGFQCRSFSYRRDDGACFLSEGNVGSTGALILSYAYDYYELDALAINCSNLYICPNKKCISYKQICDGVNDCGDRVDEKNCSAKAFGYEIKLAGSEKKGEGRLEVKAFGKAGYICDDKFGLRNGDVVCKELGFPLGALEIKSNSYYAEDLKDEDVFYMMDDVICLGNETSIRDCDFNGWGISNCEAREVVGVVCKTPQETCPKGEWKCDSVQECLPLTFVCDGVIDCTDESDEATQHCDAPTELRLADGKSKYEGRIEIRHYGIWGTVCDDDFNDDAAKVVCKYLGYPGKATAKKDGTFGPGKGPIWLDQVFCQGNESALHNCVHWNWGEHNCEHSEDVGVICSNIGSEIPVVESQRSLNIDNLPESVFMNQCGLRKDAMFLTDDKVHFRVIGGAIADKGDYPWQASLRIKNQSKMTHWCGAIVIAKKFILTAAHCLQGFSKGAYVVVAGDYNTDEDEGTEQEAFIDEFYIHEDFRKEQKMNNDIALIKLKGEGFTLTRDVQPICLPDTDIVYETGLNCTISGFGTIQSGKSMYSHDMRAAWIPIIDQEACRMPHVYGNIITDGMLCAGSLSEGADACEGDSGGPLACLYDGYYTLYGITSWGHHCGHANKPGVYVRVAEYRKWIDETILKHI